MDLTDKAESILGRELSPGALDALTGDLNERLRVRELEEVFYTAPQAAVALPSFFIHARSVSIDGCPLSATQPDLLCAGRFVISGPEMLLAQGGDVLRMVYLARLLAIEEDRINAAYTTYPSLFLYGLLYHHAALVRDVDGQQQWQPQFERALAAANENYARALQGEAAQAIRPRYRA